MRVTSCQGWGGGTLGGQKGWVPGLDIYPLQFPTPKGPKGGPRKTSWAFPFGGEMSIGPGEFLRAPCRGTTTVLRMWGGGVRGDRNAGKTR